MRLKIVFLQSRNSLPSQYENLLRDVIRKHARRAGKLLGVDFLNITFRWDHYVIPETGDSGIAFGQDWVHMAIDPARRKDEVRRIITTITPSTIYHEMNHISRNKHFGSEKSLLDAIVSEGLATVFAEEQWLAFKAPWGQYNEKELKPFLKVLRREKNNKKFSRDEWLFGRGNKPKWLGYKLGSYLIERAKDRNEGLTALGMTTKKTEEIVRLSKLEI
ncbi:MAG: DUF2268 domain-containing putative Zn-dependent protease [Acidobacteria bacterium]|nr:DUF2268 domain-containing putative Zn-dependent protease [Acidobacteriota bacterium]